MYLNVSGGGGGAAVAHTQHSVRSALYFGGGADYDPELRVVKLGPLASRPLSPREAKATRRAGM